MKNRKASKRLVKLQVKAFDKLADLVERDLSERGGVRLDPPGPLSRWTVQTKCGKLTVSVPRAIREDDGVSVFHVGDLLTVFARFEDVNAAIAALGTDSILADGYRWHGVSHPSGKWNLHHGNVSEGGMPEETFEAWARKLEIVLPKLKEVG